MLRGTHAKWVTLFLFLTGAVCAGATYTVTDLNNDINPGSFRRAINQANSVTPDQSNTQLWIGSPSLCMAEGDADAEGNVNIGDAVFFDIRVFRPLISPAPECGSER